jgi:branched-chain amino acid transport system substrate-binding protein
MNKLRRDALKYLQLPLLCAPFGIAGAAVAAAKAKLAQPIKLALVESLSGPVCKHGRSRFRNVLWATEQVNARGGVRADGLHEW